MEKGLIVRLVLVASMVFMASCGTKKTIVKDTSSVSVSEQKEISPQVRKLTFVQKVYDNQVFTKNITGDLTFEIKMDAKEISVPGSLKMRKDEVIRIQLFVPILGTEVGRIEFTPDYVLIVDRLHKEFIQADYSQVDFLRNQGISFYSLQALFWNQLLLPGTQEVKESDLKRFDVDFSVDSNNLPVSYRQGPMSYQWQADKTTGRIIQALVNYQSSNYGDSSLRMDYANFKAVGSKQFPADISLHLSTKATGKPKEVNILLRMDKITTDNKWDTHTEVSSRYKKVEPQDVLGKILNL